MNDMLERLNLKSSDKDKKAPAQEPPAEELKELREKYEKAEQDHVFSFYDELDTEGRAALFEQLQSIDPKRINELADKALKPSKSDKDDKKDGEEDDDDKKKDQKPKVQPLPESATATLLDADADQVKEWYEAGLGLIADGKVGVVLMAGGQGTRLGSTDPKGCFDIGLPSKKSLFQLQAERIYKVQQLAQKHVGNEQTPTVPWYVMTSGPTRAPTQKFFEENNYFGLSKESVVIFEQGVLPCISNEGKILMESKSKVRTYREQRIFY